MAYPENAGGYDWANILKSFGGQGTVNTTNTGSMLDPSQLNRFSGGWDAFASNNAIAGLGGAPVTTPTVTPSFFSREAAFGGGPNGGSGWAPTLLGFGQAAMGFANARSQNRLAKQNFNRYTAESNLNIENQAKGINERLQTREERRMKEQYGNLSEAERAGKVAEYMAKWGVKDKIQG